MSIKQKMIIYLTSVIFIISLIIYFIILPTIRDIKKMSDDIYAERVDLEKKYQRGQLLRKTVENFEKIKPEKDKLTSAFIIAGRELEFITTLENVASTHQLAQDIKFQRAQSEGVNTTFPSPLELTVSKGSFTKILQYLKDLERLNYYFNISSINMDVASKGQSQPVTTLRGNVYTLSLEEKK